MIQLDVLGGVALLDSDGSPIETVLSQPKTLALLILIAASGGGTPNRDQIAAVLWPDSDRRRGRRNLRTALHSLRQALGRQVFPGVRNEHVAVDRSALSCDVVAFDQAIRAGEMEDALGLYEGDFLDGFYLDDGSDFDRWADGRRQSLRAAAESAAVALCDQNAAVDLASAVKFARRAGEISPFNEGHVQVLIRLLDRSGDRAGALDAFETFAKTLARELEVEPSPETLVLVEGVRSRRDATGLAADVSASSMPSGAGAKPGNVVTPSGAPIRRTREHGRRTLVGSFAVLAMLAGAVSVWATRVQPDSRSGVPELRSDRILVDLFTNQTGDPGLDHLSGRATDHITAGLTFTTFADVVTRGTQLLSRRTDPIPADADAAQAAVERGAGTLVTGTYMLVGDSIRFDALLIDVQSGEVVRAVPSVSASLLEVTKALEILRDNVMAAISTYVDPRLAKWSRYSSKPPTMEIYRIFVEGIEAHTTDSDFERATHLFLSAAEADPTFTMAAIWATFAASNNGNLPLRDSIVGSVAERRASLAVVDRHLLDYQLAQYRNDYAAALDAILRLIEIAPGSEYLTKALGVSLRLRRPHEALGYARAASPESGWLRGWTNFWWNWGRALGATDQCQEIPPLAERARSALPLESGREVGGRLDLWGFACMGDVPRLLDAVKAYADDAERFAWQEGSTVNSLATAAARLITYAKSDTDVMPVVGFVEGYLAERIDTAPDVVSWLAELLAATGQLDSARVIVERAREEVNYGDRPQRFPGELAMLARRLAIIDVREGRHDRVDALVAEYSALRDTNPAFGLGMAAIYAHMGDLEQATTEVRKVLLELPGIWINLDRNPFSMGPLYAYPPYQELLAPRG